MPRARVIPIAVLAAACGGGGAKQPAPIGNTGPDHSRGIEKVDELSLAALIASDEWDRMIDSRTGVIELRAVASAWMEVKNEFWLRRQCGAEGAFAARSRAEIVLSRLTQNAADYRLTCGTPGETVECYQAGLAEYDLGISFRFSRRAGRYYLVGLSTVDVGSTPEQLVHDYEAEVVREDGC